VPLLERASKTATTTSVVLILALMLVVHPDITWLLRGVSVAAFVGGWLIARRDQSRIQVWLLVATIAPAFLRLLAGREGPVLDIVWMAGLGGALASLVPWSRWTLPFPWSVLIGGWALALSLAWPVLVAREIGFRFTGFFDTGAVNSWSLMSAPYAASWTLYVVLAQLLGALWFEWARQTVSSPGHPMRFLHGLWMGATAASVVAVVQGTVGLELLSTEFWASEQRATGTMLDANSYGMCAALAAPVGFLGMRTLLPRAPAASVAVFAVNWAGMWLSGSRTALLCGAVGTVALIVGLWRERRSTPQASAASGVWIAGGLAVVTVLLIAGTANPIQRALDIPRGRAGLESLWDRGGYGPIALRMTREYPLTGVGAGGYRVLAPDYWRAMSNDSLPLDNAQNWWRHQIAELGVFGGALVIAFSVLVAWRVLAGREVGPDVAAASTARGLLLGLGGASLLGMSTQNPLVLCWFFALVAWFAIFVPDPARRERRPAEVRVAWIAACGLAIAYAAGHLLLAAGSLNVVQRAERAHRDYVVGAYASEPLPVANEFRWTRQDARFFWAAKTRWMVVRFWAHHPDIASQPVHVTLTSPCGVLFDEDLTSVDSMSLGMALPEGQKTLEASLHVSRTWRPSDAGDADARELGVGIVADFSHDPAVVTSQLRMVKLPGCSGGI
jgi:O-Antigen ligase